ncbi:MAG: DUF2213 domain-containing protein, partial [Waterburya sp.]
KLDSSNSGSYLAGMTSNLAIIDGDFLGIAMTITDDKTIDDIVSGRKRQISCGYETEVEKREDGKFYQTHRTGNHIAIVEKGRAGANASIHMDSWNFELEETEENEKSEKESTNSFSDSILDKFGSENVPEKSIRLDRTSMQKFNLDGFEFETDNLDLAKHAKSVDSQLKQNRELLDSQNSRADSLTTENQELKTKLAALEGANEALKADSQKLNQDKEDLQNQLKEASTSKMSDEEVAKGVQARLDIWDQVLPEFRADNAEYKADFSKSPLQVKTEFVKLRYPNMKLDGKDPNFIDGMFEVAIASKVESNSEANFNSAQRVDGVLGQIHSQRNDESGSQKEYKSYVNDLETAWQKL